MAEKISNENLQKVAGGAGPGEPRCPWCNCGLYLRRDGIYICGCGYNTGKYTPDSPRPKREIHITRLPGGIQEVKPK